SFDPDSTEPEWALAFRWDVVLRGQGATLFESPAP
ncbi:MAG: protocatechuate 3,4-dioxygenase subunit beta, partial [Actinobacteria bacterium]|nr:protocatechuate 3,4-dioxygenase subunit beta [Actinomycetota bacterium]